MTYIIYSITGLMIFVWLGFLVHLYKTKTIYCPFDWPEWCVKAFWFVLLLTFSVWSFIAYFIWGILIKPRENRTSQVHLAHLLFILLFTFLALPINFNTGMEKARSYIKNDKGVWVETDSNQNELNFTTALHAGTIETHSNTNTTTTTSSSTGARLAAQRIAVIGENPHPLLQQVGLDLVDQIKTIPYVQEVDWFPSDDSIETGDVLPDLWIRLDLSNCDERRLGPNVSLHAAFRVMASPNFFRNSHSYHEAYDPPLIQFTFMAEHQHSSKSLFVGTRGIDYQLQANEVGKSLGIEINKFLDTQYNKFPPLPARMQQLIPAKEISVPAPLERLQDVSPIIHGTRLMTDSMRIWKIQGDEDQEAFFNAIKTELESNGWHQQSFDAVSSINAYLRFAKEQERLEVFLERKERFGSGWHVEQEKRDPPVVIVIQSVWSSPDFVIPVLADALHQKDYETILMMKDWYWNKPELREPYQAFLENYKGTNPEWLMETAYNWQRQDEPVKQWLALKKADLLYQAVGDSSQKSTIKKKLEDIQKKNPSFTEPVSSPEILQSLDIPAVDPKGETRIQKEVGLNEPLIVYGLKEDGTVETISAVMQPASFKDTDCRYALKLCNFSNGGGTTTSTSGVKDDKSDHYTWTLTLHGMKKRAEAISRSQENGQFLIDMRIF